MASQRQAHNRKRQKAILVMAVALLIIVVIAIIGLTTFLKKYSASKEVTDYSKYYKLGPAPKRSRDLLSAPPSPADRTLYPVSH